MSRQLVGIGGILLAVLGLAYESRAVVWGAIAVLTFAFLWRLIARRRGRDRPEDAQD